MAKLKHDPIVESDFIEFLDNYSDFAFEIQVLNALIGKGFSCEHGGSYTDPITKKTRQFDIRATQVFGKRFLRLAVECKNLHPNFPLLISCLPRHYDESFHEISISVNPDKYPLEEPPEVYCRAELVQSKNVRLSAERSIYKLGEPVGKSCDQVGRMLNNEINSSDSDLYAKWSQALSSAHDLTYMACNDGNDRTGDFALSLVFPVLVVPNDRLWMTQYDSDGHRLINPKKVERCSYFVNLSYFHRAALYGNELTISHLEFVTLNGLLDFIGELCGDEDKLKVSFPFEYVLEIIKSS